ncbi:MAG TPA: hypothetical protein DEV93_06750 [Chloroflexi bacterium]|nr:hypothetical protein [Chloroflexota bacterium]
MSVSLFYPLDLHALPGHWEVNALRDAVVEMRPGFASGQHNRLGTGVPHLRPMNVSPNGRLDLTNLKYVDGPNVLRVHQGDVLFNNTNSPEWVGKTAAIHGARDLAFSNHMTRIKVGPRLHPDFLALQLHYLCRAGYFRQTCTNHVNQASVSLRDLALLPVILPPFEEQGRIVAAIEEQLSRLEAAVHSMESAEARVPTLRKSVYHHLLQGAWPSVPLATVVQGDRPITYGILMPKENVPNGVPYVRVKDMTADGINVAGLRRTSTVIAEAYRRSMLRSGDVLVSIRGTYGRVAIVPAQLDGANVTQDTARVAPSAAVLAAYLAGVLRAPEAQAYMRRVARGVAVKGVNLGDLKVLPIPLPPLESQEQLMGAVQEQVDRIVRFDAVVTIALRRARLLRQSILKAAFTGRLVKRPVVNQTDGVPKTGFVVTHARVTQ